MRIAGTSHTLRQLAIGHELPESVNALISGFVLPHESAGVAVGVLWRD